MAHCVSNLTVTRPIQSQRTKPTSNTPLHSRFLQWPSISGGPRNGQYSVKAMAGNSRESLDHLQSSNKVQPQQVPKRRTVQTAPMGLWDRFPTVSTVQQMMETMERMMEDPLGVGVAWPSQLRSETGGFSRGRTPWEIKEGEGEYKLRFDMPGMTREDVKVYVEEKMLVVKAEKLVKNAKTAENGGGQDVGQEQGEWSAQSYGKYSFRIALPENVQYENIKAEVKDGVLYISIPKASTTTKVLDIDVE